jgi:hypothetical protein
LVIESSRGGIANAIIAPAAPIPLQGLEIRSQRDEEPTLALSRIQPNIQLENNYFLFQGEELRKINIRPRVSVESGEFAEHTQRMIQSIFLRKAIYDESVRDENTFGRSLDWEHLRRMDTKISALLRKVYEGNDILPGH